MKPPTFIECSVCGREFGSKSIQIHEPQCLQKLRRTEIPASDPHQSKPRRKKKLSPPFSHHGSSQQESNSAPLPSTHNSPQQSFTVPMDSRKISLPKINQEGRHTKGKGDPNSRSIARPSTATLAKPKILNIDYIQYDMSLTRIDFSSSSHSPSPVQGQNIMDENHNHKTTHRLTRQNTLVIDPSNRSPFILPAVSPTNLRSVLPTKFYKGVDVGPTKLPSSSNVVTTINSILGDPLKRTHAGSGSYGGNDNFLSRQSGKLSFKADDKCLPSRNFVPFSSSSFWSSGLILMNMQLQSIHNQSFIPDLPCYIPADDFHLESPVSYVSPTSSVSKSISFPYLHSISSSQCLIKNDDTLLEKIPQITTRTSCQPHQEISSDVTSALAAVNCKSNDSKVQDQSQAQGKRCGGHCSTCDCDCQTHLPPSLQSFQATQEEIFQIEGAALSQKQFFERLEQHGSSQEIIFLKKSGYQDWNSDANIPFEGIQNTETENQYEFHQIFMGHMLCSNSAQSISSNPHEIPKITGTEQIKCENVSSAEEEAIPAPPSLLYNYEDDFELDSQPESTHDIPNNLEPLLSDETVQSIYTPEEFATEASVDDIFPIVDSIKNVTEKLPPLCAKDTLLRKEFQGDISQEETLELARSSYEKKLAAYLTLQGSGSEGDDEESDSIDCSAIKWTSNWTIVENKPMIKSQGISNAKDSIEHMKNIKECTKTEKVVSSGRKLWNKNIGKNLDIAANFRDIVINETSISCAGKSKSKCPKTSDKQSTNIKPDVKSLDGVEYKNYRPEDVVWEGSDCQQRNIDLDALVDNGIERNSIQATAPTKSRRNSLYTSKLPPNTKRNSREASLKQQNENLAQFNKEQQAISDLVSAVYRLKRLQKSKILEDYWLERPITQGSWGYNRLGAPFAQIEKQQRPHSSPSSFQAERVLEKDSTSFKSKPKTRNSKTKKANNNVPSCEGADSVKLPDNSILRVEDKHKKLTNLQRPRTPITNKLNRPQTMTESAIRRLEKIARVYNVKPPFSAIATQTPRKGERLLTPTKDRKTAKAKVAMATQTTTKPILPKSALKKTGVYDLRPNIMSATTGIPITSSKKKTAECTFQDSESNEGAVRKKLNAPEQISEVPIKHSRRKLTANKKTDANSINQLYPIKKKSSLQNKDQHPEFVVFHSEQPSKSKIIVKSDLHSEMVSDETFNSSSEFSHYEGCGKMSKNFTHEVNVTADQDVEICYRIVPPSIVTDKKPSHSHSKCDCEDTISDTVIRLSARRMKSQESSKTLRKKSSHKEEASNFDHGSRQTIKSYSNIELMLPQDISSAGNEEFIDLNIVVRRKSELGIYPSLEKTKLGTDDSKMILLLDEEEQNPASVSGDEPSKFIQPDPSTSTSTKNNDNAISWKQYGIDFYNTPAVETPKNIICSSDQPQQYYGQEYTPAELKKYQSKNSNKGGVSSISSVDIDKVPKILYKRISRAACKNISSDALILPEHKKQTSPSVNHVENIIKEVYQKSGYTVSATQALQLISSQNMLNEFLNDSYVPKEDEQLDNIVQGIAATLRFFGILPENNQWASYFTEESEPQ